MIAAAQQTTITIPVHGSGFLSSYAAAEITAADADAQAIIVF